LGLNWLSIGGVSLTEFSTKGIIGKVGRVVIVLGRISSDLNSESISKRGDKAEASSRGLARIGVLWSKVMLNTERAIAMPHPWGNWLG
jgi:hypothetical protein